MTDGNISKRNGLAGALADGANLLAPAAEAPPTAGTATADELARIPRLGPVRRKALADAGIYTLAQLRALPYEDLAAIKYIGSGNARLIKAWLETAGRADSEPLLPAVAADLSPAAAGAQPVDTHLPPAPPELLLEPPHPAQVPELPDDLFSPETALANQAAYDDLGQIDGAIASLKDALPKKSRNPRLKKQLQKVSSSISEVPEGLDHLSDQERADAAKALDRIAKLLMSAVEEGKLSDKKQQAVGTKLRKLRKRLDRVVCG